MLNYKLDISTMDANINPRNIIILTLQLTLIRNAICAGWTVRRINEKQIELTKKFNKYDNYEKLCSELIFESLKYMDKF